MSGDPISLYSRASATLFHYQSYYIQLNPQQSAFYATGSVEKYKFENLLSKLDVVKEVCDGLVSAYKIHFTGEEDYT